MSVHSGVFSAVLVE